MTRNIMNSRLAVQIVAQEPRHAQGLFQALSDPAIYEFLDEDPPADVETVRRRLVHLQRGASEDGSEKWLNWTIFVGPRVVGYTQATVFEDKTASIACVLSSDEWGKGCAYSACQQMISQLAEKYAIERLLADTEDGNLASQRFLARLGFQQISRSKGDIYYALDCPELISGNHR